MPLTNIQQYIFLFTSSFLILLNSIFGLSFGFALNETTQLNFASKQQLTNSNTSSTLFTKFPRTAAALTSKIVKVSSLISNPTKLAFEPSLIIGNSTKGLLTAGKESYTNGFTTQLLQLLNEKKKKPLRLAFEGSDQVAFPRLESVANNLKKQNILAKEQYESKNLLAKKVLEEEKNRLDYFLNSIAQNSNVLRFLLPNSAKEERLSYEILQQKQQKNQQKPFSNVSNNKSTQNKNHLVRKYPTRSESGMWKSQLYYSPSKSPNEYSSQTKPHLDNYIHQYSSVSDDDPIPVGLVKLSDLPLLESKLGGYSVFATNSQNHAPSGTDVVTLNDNDVIENVMCSDCCRPICPNRLPYIKPLVPAPVPIVSRVSASMQLQQQIPQSQQFLPCNSLFPSALPTPTPIQPLPRCTTDSVANNCISIPQISMPCPIQPNSGCGCSQPSAKSKSSKVIHFPELEAITEREINKFVDKLLMQNKPLKYQTRNSIYGMHDVPDIYLNRKDSNFYENINHDKFGSFLESNYASQPSSIFTSTTNEDDNDDESNFYETQQKKPKKYFAVENPFSNKFFVEQSVTGHNFRGAHLIQPAQEIFRSPAKKYASITAPAHPSSSYKESFQKNYFKVLQPHHDSDHSEKLKNELTPFANVFYQLDSPKISIEQS